MDNREHLDLTSTVSSTSLESTATEVIPKKPRLAKTPRDQFFTIVTKNEKNWSAKCLLCAEVVLDSIGVTSNVNRHVKIHHRVEFDQWTKQLSEVDPNQPKLIDFVSKKNQSSSCLKR